MVVNSEDFGLDIVPKPISDNKKNSAQKIHHVSAIELETSKIHLSMKMQNYY